MRRAIFASALAWATLAAGSAAAQSKDDVARADALFKTAKGQLAHGLAADACANFAESKRLAPGIGVTLYLADCYQRIGKTASAWTEFQSAEATARGHGDGKRADLARKRAEAIEPKLGHLTIRVTGPQPTDDAPLQITCDGKPVTQQEWGTPIPVDPGEHVVVARPGAWERTLGTHLDAGTLAATVAVDLPAAAPEAPAAPVAAAAAPASLSPTSPPPSGEQPPAAPAAETPAAREHPSAEAAGGPSERVWIALGLGGAGVVGVAIGTAFGVMATSHRNQSNAGPCDAADFCSAAGLALRHDALTDATVSTVAFAVGLAALGTGAAVYLLAPSGPSGSGLSVAVSPVASGGGAILRTSF